MKNILFILFLSTSALFANPASNFNNYSKKLLKVEPLRTTCEIIRDNNYTYCKRYGFTESESKAISNAAFEKCKELTKSTAVAE